MPRKRFAKLLLAVLLPVMLWAQDAPQAPKKPAAKAPQKSEEKKPAEYSQEAFVIEQLQTRVRFETDGTSQQESLAVVKVQSEEGVQQFGEQSIAYDSANQKVEIEYIRVRKADGRVITAGADAVQDLNTPLAQDAPAYKDYRVKHLSAPALRPGNTLEYKIVTRTETPLAPGNFWFNYDFEKNAIVLDERLEIDVPKSREVHLKTRPGVEPKLAELDDRRIYLWKRSNLEHRAEEDEKNKSSDEPAVQLTTFSHWAEVGRWYAALEKERVATTEEIRAKAAKLIEGRATELEKIEALYDFVAKNIRSVNLRFGAGGYQPHAASEALANQYGDSKDKHTLLASLLEAAGIHSEAVLISSQKKIDEEVPSPAQFDRVITRVRTKATGPAPTEGRASEEAGDSAGDIWLDTTTEVAPFGMLSANLRGKKALVISRDATPSLVDTPVDPPFASTQLVEIEGKLSEQGKLTAKVKFTLRGDAELTLRLAFRRTAQSQWKQIAQWSAISDGFRGEVTEVKVGDPAATREPFQFEYTLAQAKFLDLSNKKSQMSLPLPSMGMPSAPEDKEGEAKKIELGTPLESVTRLTLELPPNFKAHAPVSVAVTRDYAEYRSSYKMEQKVLRAERTVKFKLRELAGERSGDYRAFVRAVRTDEGQTLLVESTAPEQIPPAPKTAPDNRIRGDGFRR